MDDRLFTNVAAYDITVSKTVTGYGNKQVDFDFILTLVNEYSFDLDDVTWTKGNETGSLADLLIIEEDTGDDDESTDATEPKITRYAFTLKHDETITFSNLPYGTSYTVQEVLDDLFSKVFETTVTVSDTEAAAEDRTVTGKIENAGVTVAYENYSKYQIFEFPETGGSGMLPFSLPGNSLILAGLYILFRKRRYNRG